MKIALIRPNYHSHIVTPPLGLGYLLSALKNAGHEVIFIDGLNMKLSDEDIVERAKDCNLIGITVLSAFYVPAKRLTKQFKELGKKVVLGGVHPTVMPVPTLRDTGADYIVMGEGEITIVELVKAIENKEDVNRVPGVVTLQNYDNYSVRDFISNLDDIAWPDWKVVDPRNYKEPHGAIIKNFPVAPVMTTRGCPYNCSFCVSPQFWQKKFRLRSPKNVVDEIEYLIKEFGVKEIHFEDDNLTLVRAHIEEICNLVISRNLNISWATPNGIRADRVDEELLRLMKRAGCYYVVFGVESANESILKTIDKKESLDDIKKAIATAKKVGLMTQGFFIFGLPGETEETIKNSLRFAKESKLSRAHFMLLDIVPGSRLWGEHKDELSYDIENDDYLSYQEVTWIPPTITKDALKAWQGRAIRKFLFHPRSLYSLLKYFRLWQLENVLSRLKDYRVLSFFDKNKKSK